MMMMGYVVRSVCYDTIVIDVRSMSCRPSKKIEYFKYDVSSKILILIKIIIDKKRRQRRRGEGREQWKLREVFLTKKNVNILSGLFPFVSFKQGRCCGCQILVLLSTFVSVCTYLYGIRIELIVRVCLLLEANVFKAGEFVGT